MFETKLNSDSKVDSTNNSVQFSSKEENLHYEGVFDVEPSEVRSFADKIQIVDVRQSEEYSGDLGHIKNSILIPLDELPDEVNKISKSKPIVFVCRSGNRSARAASYLMDLGYPEVYNLKGGMLYWNELGFEVQNLD